MSLESVADGHLVCIVLQEGFPLSFHQLPEDQVQLVHVHFDQLPSAGFDFRLAGPIWDDRLKPAIDGEQITDLARHLEIVVNVHQPNVHPHPL